MRFMLAISFLRSRNKDGDVAPKELGETTASRAKCPVLPRASAAALLTSAGRSSSHSADSELRLPSVAHGAASRTVAQRALVSFAGETARRRVGELRAAQFLRILARDDPARASRSPPRSSSTRARRRGAAAYPRASSRRANSFERSHRPAPHAPRGLHRVVPQRDDLFGHALLLASQASQVHCAMRVSSATQS